MAFVVFATCDTSSKLTVGAACTRYDGSKDQASGRIAGAKFDAIAIASLVTELAGVTGSIGFACPLVADLVGFAGLGGGEDEAT